MLLFGVLVNIVNIVIDKNEVSASEQSTAVHGGKVRKKSIVYSRQELLDIRESTKHSRLLRIMTPQVMYNIRVCRINRRKTRRWKRGGMKQKRKVLDEKRGINMDNLISIGINDRDVSNKNQNFRIGLINARSVKNKEILLMNEIKESNIDICVVTETWLTDSDDIWLTASEFNSDGYSVANANRMAGKGGGLALITKSVDVSLTVSANKKTFEYAIWTLKVKNDILNIFAIYRPPYSKKHQRTIPQFIDEFLETLSDETCSLENTIILGDFNIHVDLENDPDAQMLIDSMEALGLDQHVKFETHDKGHILDHVYAAAISDVKVIDCIPGTFISDHRFIICSVSIEKDEVARKTILSRSFHKLDLDKFGEMIDFGDTSEISNLDILVDNMDEITTKALNHLVPEKMIRVTERKKEIWFNEDIKNQRKLVRRRERIWRHYKEDHQLRAFKVERNRLNRMLFAAKKETISEMVIKCGKDSKALYQLVNNITGVKKVNPLPDSQSDKHLAEEFADFFLGKIIKIRQDLCEKSLYTPSNEISNIMKTFKPVSEDYVRKVIMSMSTKSCELDSLPTNILKKVMDKYLPMITRIINISLEQGIFVSKWKTAIVRPLIKKAGLDLILSSYRPVSNLNFLSKVLEKVVLDQFLEHCSNYDLFPSYQSAYRKFYSCETALIKLTNDILRNMDNQMVTSLAAIDLSAAFDTVDHSVLLNVLSTNFGMKGVCLQWFENYLRSRDFKVVINRDYSSSRALDFSVPQGSVAGPSLYSAYASTMRKCVPDNIDLHGYADDHALKISFSANNTAQEKSAIIELENCLAHVKTWMDGNRLKMNDSKTEFILFGSRQQLGKCITNSLSVNDCQIDKVNNIKYLGVYLDASMTMKTHITQKCRIAMANYYRLSKIRKYLTEDACKQIVHGLIISHIDYSNSLFFGLPKCDIQRLQRVQSMAAKMILRKRKYDSVTKTLKELHWLPVRLRIEFKILTMVWKCLNNQAPQYLVELLKLKSPGRALRSTTRQDLEVPRTKCKTFGDRSFSVSGPLLWNRLPMSIRNAESLDLFKSKLKTFMFLKF
jgi:exonuclease III